MKKTTIRDIAAAAGVSTATVSYILNNHPNQSISMETRNRVLKIAKELRYTPNLSAISLVKKRTGLIGVLIGRNKEEGPWKRTHEAGFLEALEKALRGRGFHMAVAYIQEGDSPEGSIFGREMDGILMVNVSKELFYSVSYQFYIGCPIVLLDCLLPEDPLFYQLIPDYAAIIREAGTRLGGPIDYIVMDCINSEELTALIRDTAGIESSRLIFMTQEMLASADHRLQAIQGHRGLIVGEGLALMLRSRVKIDHYAVLCLSSDNWMPFPEDVPLIRQGSPIGEALRLLEHLMAGEFEFPGAERKRVPIAPLA